MKKISISQKIKILASLSMLAVFIGISITIYLNEKNIKDATIINIAGEQRMLTQKISKNIFSPSSQNTKNFEELNSAILKFNQNIKTLQNGDLHLGISSAPTQKINTQITKVLLLWNTFEKNTILFQEVVMKNDSEKLDQLIHYFENSNIELLNEVDTVVTLYTNHIEEKTTFIKKFQYLSFILLFIFSIFAIIQLRKIEMNARNFLSKSKNITIDDIQHKELLNAEEEPELVEMADNFNAFIHKVSSAMEYSQTALEQSKIASKKLENLAEEFYTIIDEIEDKTEISKQLDQSENIVIESNEEIIRSTRKLQKLKNELDKILASCQ